MGRGEASASIGRVVDVSSGISAADRSQHIDDRLRILSAVLRDFAEATADYERLLDVVARKLAEVGKDGCVVRLLSEGGWLSPVAIHMPVEERVRDADVLAQLRAHMSALHNVGEQGA